MRPNLVLITLDCVRPDHLGCYGYKGVETIHLDRMAASGVLFEEALTHAPNTWVAHATLFTGCLPSVHGMRAPEHRIYLRVTMLAEWFAAHGWSTAAFPGTTLVGKAQGFHRGFHLFDTEWEKEGLHTERAAWRRNWRKALERALSWIGEAKEPFLIWIHYIDTHHLPEVGLPYYFQNRFSPQWQHYDGKISYADQACVGEVLSFLEQRGLLDRTAVTVFSDHGEELHEDDRPLHDGGLGEDVIRVPLILALPDAAWIGGVRVKGAVGLVDLFPTLCDLAGVSPPPGIQGVSLVPMIRRDSLPDPGRPIYIENWPKGLFGLRTREWKLILRHPNPEQWELVQPLVEALYHLPTDPRELCNVAERHPAIVRELSRECARWALGRSPEQAPTSEQEAIQRALEGLGYV